MKNKLKIEMRKTTNLVPYAKNPKTHSDEQVQQIAASIKEFGFNNPIAVKGKQVIAGHGRLLAASLLKLDVVPVVALDHLTEIQAKAYTIADNKLTENGGWDEHLLDTELNDLFDCGVTLNLLGFDNDEISQYLMDIEPDELPDLRAGDQGDSRSLAFILTEEGRDTVLKCLAILASRPVTPDLSALPPRGAALVTLCKLFLKKEDA